MQNYQDYQKGRGAQINLENPFLNSSYSTVEEEGLDVPLEGNISTQVIFDHPRKVLNKVTSPDIPLEYSINPYQGCEHGCVYCYARNAHHYWGLSAGLDFERKIIVKPQVAELLKKELSARNWKPTPVMFSGNTDCYQPVEKRFELTRKCLKVFLSFGNPVGLITKNSLILRDLDLLKSLAEKDLVHVYVTITTLNESLRRVMEPRTATAKKRLKVVETLAKNGVPVGIMCGPVIPGLNNHEIPGLIKAAADAGALNAGYTFVRLNGALGQIFEDWLRKNFPDRADKVLGQIRVSHGGKLNDSRFGTRMRGEGAIAQSVADLFKLAKKQHLTGREMPPYTLEHFAIPGRGRQLKIFG